MYTCNYVLPARSKPTFGRGTLREMLYLATTTYQRSSHQGSGEQREEHLSRHRSLESRKGRGVYPGVGPFNNNKGTEELLKQRGTDKEGTVRIRIIIAHVVPESIIIINLHSNFYTFIMWHSFLYKMYSPLSATGNLL